MKEVTKMVMVKYTCANCGKVVMKDILAIEHAIRGTGRKINREARCCTQPAYVDDKGYCKIPRGGLITTGATTEA
ncbi:MAG: hypothetical protein ABEJ83_00805 [Candidatus Nanohaloarchaea archaeon]